MDAETTKAIADAVSAAMQVHARAFDDSEKALAEAERKVAEAAKKLSDAETKVAALEAANKKLEKSQVTWAVRGTYGGAGLAVGAALGTAITYYAMKPPTP